MPAGFPRDGIFAALHVPFDEGGAVMKASLAAQCRWLAEAGVHGVLALGSTGGFPYLSIARKKEVLDAVAEFAGPLAVLANISDIRPSVVTEIGRHARSLALAGVAIMPPDFFPVAQEDQLVHFLHAADASGLPVMLYNFPELTGNRINPETIVAFSERAPMAAIKQSGGELSYHRELIALGQERDFSVFTGADTRLPEIFGMGARGCTGGLVNLVPEFMVEQFRVFREGKAGSREPTAGRMQRVGDEVQRVALPFNIQAGMRARGFDPGYPVIPLSAETHRRMDDITRNLRRCFQEWGLPPVTEQHDLLQKG